jgi:hypothetical protein
MGGAAPCMDRHLGCGVSFGVRARMHHWSERNASEDASFGYVGSIRFTDI